MLRLCFSASAQRRLAVSWSVDRCWTRVPRRRRGGRGETRTRDERCCEEVDEEERDRTGLFERRLVGVLVSFASRISIGPRIKQPACILWPSPADPGHAHAIPQGMASENRESEIYMLILYEYINISTIIMDINVHGKRDNLNVINSAVNDSVYLRD